jgi:hypothetical protein
MSIFLFSNNASTTLASSITNSITSLTVAATTGSEFPSPSAGQVAAITVEDVSGNIEVMYCTGRSGDTLTVTRGAEGTTALAFSSGARVEQRITAAVLASLLQKTGGDTLSGTTSLTGVISSGSAGSIQGGEIAGAALRSQPGDTSNQILIPIGSGGATLAGSPILTAANIGSNLLSGTALIVTGMVVMWTGLSSAVPSGWHLCDGTAGTVDLRDQFIVGGGGSLPSSGTYPSTTGAASAGTPSISPVTLTAANLPAHFHTNTIYAGNAGQIVGPGGTSAGGYYFTGSAGAGVAVNWNTGNGNGTDTPITFTGVALGSHTHSVSAPPYKAVFMIQKL